MNKNQKYIYVILTKCMTLPGKVIRKFTGGEYSHASISLDKDLNEMYSFARFYYHTPIVAGFTNESLTSLSLGKEEDIEFKIFRIPVTGYQYRIIKKQIEYFKNNSDKYLYNLFGLIFYPMNIEFNVKDTYICTEWVAKTLAIGKIKSKQLNRNRISPIEIMDILKEYEYYSGSIAEYAKGVSHKKYNPEFLEREKFLSMLGKSIKQIGILIYRKII